MRDHQGGSGRTQIRATRQGEFLKTLYWLQAMFKIESYAFHDMFGISSVNSVDRLIELRTRVLQEQKKGIDTPFRTSTKTAAA